MLVDGEVPARVDHVVGVGALDDRRALDDVPRLQAFAVAREHGAGLRFVAIAEAVERAIPQVIGKELKLNVSAAIPAVLLDVGFPLLALKGVPILARTAGLIAHLNEELEQSIGFALSYQASRDVVYEGEVPEGFARPA